MVLLPRSLPLKASFFPSIVLGGIFSIFFYGAIHKGWISQPLVVRYFASHPIEYVITITFFVGLALLIVKYFSILSQRQLLRHCPILPMHPMPIPVEHAGDDLEIVLQCEKQHGVSLLTERLKHLLHSLYRNQSTNTLDAEMRSRADDAVAKADADYGFVRLILWAIPMIGFLGTVIGITAALDNLDLNTMSESSKKLSAGLAVAFDTTGLAIALAVKLFFVQFLVHREESRLLTETDQLTEQEICGRFIPSGMHDGQHSESQNQNEQVIATVQSMLEMITNSIEQAAKKQTYIWEQCAVTFKTALASALSESMEFHAKVLMEAEAELLSQTNKTMCQFSGVFAKSADSVLALREETTKQTELLREVLGANSQLIQLEERLRQNLNVLATVGNFEETVNSLAAAIHLLNNNRRSELRAS